VDGLLGGLGADQEALETALSTSTVGISTCASNFSGDAGRERLKNHRELEVDFLDATLPDEDGRLEWEVDAEGWEFAAFFDALLPLDEGRLEDMAGTVERKFADAFWAALPADEGRIARVAVGGER
jgi:hypothetical protein